MGISQLAVHNVLRTYSRQEGIGRAQRSRSSPPGGAPRSSDLVTLSPAARKSQWLGQLAAEVVDGRHPDLSAEERAVRIRKAKDELQDRHGDEIRDDSLAPEAFEASLRRLHLS